MTKTARKGLPALPSSSLLPGEKEFQSRLALILTFSPREKEF
jgi:hypothetical protein